jgi:predicted nucleic acid-binding Zn ribbon protein
MKSGTPRVLADILVNAVPQLSEKLPEYHIMKTWAALVGSEVARRTRPHALANGCLHVIVDNSPWLHELTLRTGELTERLRAQVPAVRSLRFTLGTLETEPRSRRERRERRAAALTDADRRDIDEAASAISDPALADVARRLLTTARRFPAGARGTAS